ncbi:MAG: type III-A CRISPR-associated RAMP protein Csm5 [Saprospiraceae bacterium]|nr:type III-A CRISPR-associated RAMP protein Csm5 [Saprospiraceae bacterium]MDW8483099.1 type III-A CRISPR-associated RAMP protein Csm5 [Saprospiraceae bacterium]
MQNTTISLPLRLKVITPVHIGDDKGKTLSPYCDYVFSDDGQYLHYLDLRKIEEAVTKANALEEYIRLIGAMDNNRSEMDLKRFLTGKLSLAVPQVTRCRLAQKGLKSSDKLHIMTTVKNAGQPYLPGSSLKGALRTAILYDWLVCTEAGKSVIEGYRVLIEKAAREYSKVSTSQRSRHSSNKEIRQIKSELEKNIFKEEELFGFLNSGNRAPDSQYLRVRDSQPVSIEQLGVYALRRIRITSGKDKSAIPQVVEAIKPGTELETDISIRPEFHNKYFDYWKDRNFRSIFENLNVFSKDCIDNELHELNDALDNAENLDFSDEIEALVEFYEDLKAKANNGAIFLRLGFGKTINDNSLILALLYGLDNDETWHLFREVIHGIRRRDAFFPVTRAIAPDGKPMGWVEVLPN